MSTYSGSKHCPKLGHKHWLSSFVDWYLQNVGELFPRRPRDCSLSRKPNFHIHIDLDSHANPLDPRASHLRVRTMACGTKILSSFHHRPAAAMTLRLSGTVKLRQQQRGDSSRVASLSCQVVWCYCTVLYGTLFVTQKTMTSRIVKRTDRSVFLYAVWYATVWYYNM